MVLAALAQNKGRFEAHDVDNVKLHVYYTNDALGDVSYIIEGSDGLVTLEQPLFKDNVAEFDAYLAKLNKPVVQRIADYHVGGTAAQLRGNARRDARLCQRRYLRRYDEKLCTNLW